MVKIVTVILVVLVLITTFILIVKNNNRGNEVIRSGVHNVSQKLYKGWYNGFSWQGNKITAPSFEDNWADCDNNQNCLLQGEKAIKTTTDQLIRNLWFRQQFIQDRLQFDNELFKVKYDAFVKNTGNYQQFLQKTSLADDDVISLVRDRVYTDLVVRNELLKVVSPTEEEIQTIYKSDIDKKYSKEKRDVKILAFRTEEAANKALDIIKETNSWKKAMDMLPTVNTQIENTYSFTRSAAKKHSIFESKLNRTYGPFFIASSKYWIIYQVTNVEPSKRIEKEAAENNLRQEIIKQRIKKENSEFQRYMFNTWRPRTECEPKFATNLCFNSIDNTN